MGVLRKARRRSKRARLIILKRLGVFVGGAGMYIATVPVVGPFFTQVVPRVRQVYYDFRGEDDDDDELVETSTEIVLVETPAKEISIAPSFLYRQYRCKYGNPLSCICTQMQQMAPADPKATVCAECSFPATLLQKSEIRGSLGIYRVEELVARRGMGRLYHGVQVQNEQPVTIKEFLLPNRCFNPQEAKQRQEVFTHLAGLRLADGKTTDFRLISPLEAIADAQGDRCYIITQGDLDTCATLGDYLREQGAMSETQIRLLLHQILQTLEFLHGQKFRLPSEYIQQGFAHGNLSLDSLLIKPEEEGFFIYITDLAMWEFLFEPPPASIPASAFNEDLKALGYSSFYLLAGKTMDADTGVPLDPRNHRYWGTIDPYLKEFILRLMGIEAPFASAELARRALLQLPQSKLVEVASLEVLPEAKQKRGNNRRLMLILGLVGFLAFLALLAWWLRPKPRYGTALAQTGSLLCCIKDVTATPTGKFVYTSEKGGTWSYVLEQTNLILRGKTLEEILRARKPKLSLTYRPEDGIGQAITKVQQDQAAFAIVPGTIESIAAAPLVTGVDPSTINTNTLGQKEIAYDGLMVFVSFTYAQRDNSLPKFLKGQLTFEQLRQLYTGQVQNWQSFGGPNLPVKLYIPNEPEAVAIFEQRVLKEEVQITAFRDLVIKKQITPLPTFDALRQVIRDFEESQVGSISFGTVSKVFGQCSAYPLALVDDGKIPVQALIRDNGNPIDPTTNLCDEKGSYRPDIPAFSRSLYPLSYPISIIYPRDNSRPPAGEKVADMLRTLEGQRLLSRTGLLPIQPLPKQ